MLITLIFKLFHHRLDGLDGPSLGGGRADFDVLNGEGSPRGDRVVLPFHLWRVEWRPGPGSARTPLPSAGQGGDLPAQPAGAGVETEQRVEAAHGGAGER